VVLGDRAAELAALAGDIAQPGMAFGARPVVHLVEELAALVRRAGAGMARTTPPPPTIFSNRPNPKR
jgi:hypothetical protein